MKLHFESNLEHQSSAIEAVCALFKGQEIYQNELTVTSSQNEWNQNLDARLGNNLLLSSEQLYKNLKDIQFGNSLAPSPELLSHDFTVEMETGTGKTYVYLRTILELNKRYGFNKFIIVVHSIAIKEGVYKTLEIVSDHFKALYSGTPFEYFLYDSGKLGDLRNFVTSHHIQIMIMTVGAINKANINNLYKDSEKMGGEKPIDLIRSACPIVIVDEPQSVDGGSAGKGKEALEKMNPLCTLRYSATHEDKHHMVYRLDAVDAYEKKLVKQIEVASVTVEEAYNKAFVRLVSVSNTRGTISAKVELDKKTSEGVKRQEFNVYDGDDLQAITKRTVYQGFFIGEISSAKKDAFVELRHPAGELFLKTGEVFGNVDQLEIQRQMISRTIREHLDKEKTLLPQGIKVLSLFFIDAVDKYRQYDENGKEVKGEYARIFEEEFLSLSKSPTYRELFAHLDLNDPTSVTNLVQNSHNGYFSIDKKGGWTDTSENTTGARENAERAYNLIMKDKEKLLSIKTPLKFIFSHSALREGWDNPNVFQICALRNIQTERARRQTVGRGLRLCVDQDGKRVLDPSVNVLTVIANEGYKEYAENLQKEIESETGIRFGVVEEYQFEGITVVSSNGKEQSLGSEQSKDLQNYLKANLYLDDQGMVQEKLKSALANNSLSLPEKFLPYNDKILEILRKSCGRLEIKNANERQKVSLRKGLDGKAVCLSEDFKQLWDRIKHKTVYHVKFDKNKLIESCAKSLELAQPIERSRLQWSKADIFIDKSGVSTIEKDGASTVLLKDRNFELPDMITDLQVKTGLTRSSIVQILLKSGRLDEFKTNPQQFIDLASQIINRGKKVVLVEGIKYQKIGDKDVYTQEAFEKEELVGYLKNTIKSNKSICEHVIFDSETEKLFAEGLEKNDAVKLYTKLPKWFQIPTPLGNYNPDWAVLIEEENTQKLYFVVETKGSLFADDLRETENAKIKCGEAHFEALADGDNPASYIKAHKINDLLVHVHKRIQE